MCCTGSDVGDGSNVGAGTDTGGEASVVLGFAEMGG